jgi:hypothetical protein
MASRLRNGATFTLDADKKPGIPRVHLPIENPQKLEASHNVLIDDGRCGCADRADESAVAQVIVGGRISIGA